MEQEQPVVKQPSVFWKIIRRFFFWTVFAFLLLVGTGVALVYIYEDDAKQAVIDELNKHLNAEVKIDPKNIDFTIIKTFPNAAVEFKNSMAYEALKKENRDTLFTAGLISLQFNVLDIFNGNYHIKKIKISEAQLNLKVDKNGNENYIFWKTDTVNVSKNEKVAFKLEKIELNKITVKYKNKKSFVKFLTTINEARVNGEFSDVNYVLKSEGKLAIDELVLDKRRMLSNKNLDYFFDIDVSGDKYTFKNADIAINKLTLSTSGFLEKTGDAWFADLNIKGKNIDVGSTLSLLPQSQQEKIKDYASDGLFYIDGKIKGDLGSPEELEIESKFGIQNATIKYIPNGALLEKVNLNGFYQKSKAHPEKLELKNISAQLNTNSVSGNLVLTGFADPYIELDAKGNVSLQDIQKFYPIDTLTVFEGALNFDVYINGSVNGLKNNFSDNVEKSTGKAELANVKLKFKNDDKEISITSGKLSLNKNTVIAENINTQIGKSDAVINGTLQNFIGWIFKDDQGLLVEAKLESKFISIDELLTNPESSPKSTKPYELEISDKINLNLDLHVAETALGKFSAKDIVGRIRIKDKKIYSENLSLETMGGDVTLTGIIDAAKENNIEIGGSCKLVGIDINKSFYQMNNFGQEAIQDKHLKGLATASIDFSSRWSKTLICDLSKVEVSSDLTIEKGELLNYKPLESLAKYVELKDLQDIKFSTFQSHIDIKNQVISLSKTSIKNNAMNMDIYGNHTFNNEIDYHIKLLLSEVMAKRPGKSKQLDEELALVENDPENKRCVFLTMTGTLDNPIIKYDRKGMKEKIKDDIKNEKQNLKQILFEEFGLFKKDSANFKNKKEEVKKSDQKFQVDFGNVKKPESKNPNDPKAVKPSVKNPETKDDDDDF